MGNLFGIFHRKETTQGPFINPADSFFRNSVLRVYIPPTVSAKKCSAIMEGFRRWAWILAKPEIGITLEQTDNAAAAQIVVSFSPNKPKANGREVWAVTDLVPVDPAKQKDLARALVTFWSGLSDGDQKKSAAHEAGHSFGLRGHSVGGVMDPNIEDDYPGKFDETTLVNSYRQRPTYLP